MSDLNTTVQEPAQEPAPAPPSEATIQRDAALEELAAVKEQMSKISAELEDTKKANYRLAMQGAGAPTMSFDDALIGLLGLKRGETKT